MGSANGALELIGRATGLLNNKQLPQQVPITRVVVHMGDGEEDQVTEIRDASYRELPAPPEEDAGGKTRMKCPKLPPRSREPARLSRRRRSWPWFWSLA